MKKKIIIFIISILIILETILGRVVFLADASNFGSVSKNGMLLSSSYEEKKKDAENRNKELEKNRKATENMLEEIRNSLSDLYDRIEELDMAMMENDGYIEKLEQRIVEKEKELNDTRILLEDTKALEKAQYDNMGKRIQYMYENGNQTLLDIIISSSSFADFLNQAEYFQKISEYDNNLFNSYIETKKKAEETEAVLELDLASLEDLYSEAEFNRQVLLELMVEKSNAIMEYTAMMGIQEELLENYMEDIFLTNREIEDIIAEEQERIRREEEERKKAEEELKRREEEEKKRIEKERQDAINGVIQSGETSIDKMIWPLPGDGRVFSGFGSRVAPTKGASTYHQGVDIGGEYNAHIVAALAGTVSDVAYNATSGNYVKIDHGGELVTAYLHCSKQLVTVGQYVMQGEVIALVGSTGVSTGPHLHFGVSINGTYVDPMKYIRYK